MDIIISNSSGVPIYEQIEEQIKGQIMACACQRIKDQYYHDEACL